MTDEHKSLVPRPAEAQWYYQRDGVEVGPVSEPSLLARAKLGQITPDTPIWQAAIGRWREAKSVPLVAAHLGQRDELLETDVPLEPQDLNEAVSDEEAAEPFVDIQQAREILKRSSVYPSERSIPPASHTPMPTPVRKLPRLPMGVPQLVGLGGACLIAATLVVVFVSRQPETPDYEAAPPAERRASLAATPQGVIPIASNPTAKTEPPAESGIVSAGSLDAQLLASQLQHALPILDRQCWERLRVPVGEVTKHPSLRINLSLDRQGRIYDIESSKDPLGYRGVGHCIIGRIRGWRFPPGEQGTHAVINVGRARG
jgi:hypothetical protein